MHLLGHHLPDHKPVLVCSAFSPYASPADTPVLPLLLPFPPADPLILPLMALQPKTPSPPPPPPPSQQIALHSFYGISSSTSHRLLARLQINAGCLVSQLTEPQITSLSAYLSSPATSPRPPATPLAIPGSSEVVERKSSGVGGVDPMDGLRIETDLRRSMLADIQHQRQVASYRGRRIAQGLPVRGQRTKTNAQTAKKLNRVERRRFSTMAFPTARVWSSPILSMLASRRLGW